MGRFPGEVDLVEAGMMQTGPTVCRDEEVSYFVKDPKIRKTFDYMRQEYGKREMEVAGWQKA